MATFLVLTQSHSSAGATKAATAAAAVAELSAELMAVAKFEVSVDVGRQ